ncbi:MAG: FAD:protein FMN transferase [Proteobacteria bacterium]|nr:FAD:protein FMN transferase [Pseudomonadota bacterium]
MKHKIWVLAVALCIIALLVFLACGLIFGGFERWFAPAECRHVFEISTRKAEISTPYSSEGCARLQTAFRLAENEIRRVDLLVSPRQESSEIARFNDADPGVEIPMSADTLALLRIARQYYDVTGGAFDITLEPVIEIWREARQNSLLPLDESLQAARENSGWSNIIFSMDGIRKKQYPGRIHLQAIAKGYSIDRAVQSLIHGGLPQGRVSVRGCTRVFGESEAMLTVTDLKDASRQILVFGLRNAASGSSGNPSRFFKIDDHLFSHIIDPRTLRPSQYLTQAIAVAPSAMTADAWATALAVMGVEGFDILPAEVSAFIQVQVEDTVHYYANRAFTNLILHSNIDIQVLEASPPSPAP